MWKISDDNTKTLRIPNTAPPPPPQKKRPGKAYDEEVLYSNLF